MDQHQGNNIEALSKWLELLRITKENASKEITEYIDEMLVVSAPAMV